MTQSPYYQPTGDGPLGYGVQPADISDVTLADATRDSPSGYGDHPADISDNLYSFRELENRGKIREENGGICSCRTPDYRRAKYRQGCIEPDS